MDEAASGSTLPFLPLRQVPQVDWTQLPADLVAAICKRLHDLFDFVYFRAVCRKWRTATAISDLPPQIPWILTLIDTKHLGVYSLITGKTRTIHFPKIPGHCMLFRGPCYGYLYSCDSVPAPDHWNHCLWNPLTNHEVHFEVERDFDGIVFCMDPYIMGKNSYIAFKKRNGDRVMGFYQPHSRKWYYVPVPLPLFSHIKGRACLNGSYYMVDAATDNTVVVDIAKGSSFSVPPPDNLRSECDVCFVESAGKVLMIVMWLDLGSIPSNFNPSFKIYQLDDKNRMGKDQFHW